MNEFLSNFPGFFNQYDYSAIAEIAKLLPDQGTLVEIGTFFGRSAACWATILKELGKTYHIYTLDRFKIVSKHLHQSGKIKLVSGDRKLIRPFIMADLNHEEMTKHLLKDFTNITVVNYDIFEDSPAKLNLDNVQCVFEDADHSSLGVRRNFTDWYPLVVSNGIYSGHDYRDDNFPEVKIEVDSFVKENNLTIKLPNSDSSVYYIQKQ